MIINAAAKANTERYLRIQSRKMNAVRFLAYLVIALVLVGCGRKGGSGGDASTNLSVVVWSPFTPVTNSYDHIAHLQQLQNMANAMIATNSAIFSQAQARDELADGSPLRGLLGIPAGEKADLAWSQSVSQRYIVARSPITGQRFGRIKVNLKTGGIDSVHDVTALVVISEMERRLRQIVGTREEALRLFASESSSSERDEAIEALSEALLLPPNTKLLVRMSAPGGSNGGYGHLRIEAISENSFENLAYVGYPPVHGLASAFGFSRPDYTFGGLRLESAWTNLNTQGFLLDGEGLPYPGLP